MVQLTEETGKELLKYLKSGIIQAQALDPLPPELGSVQTELSAQYMPGKFKGDTQDLRQYKGTAANPEAPLASRLSGLAGGTYAGASDRNRPQGPTAPPTVTRPAEQPEVPELKSGFFDADGLRAALKSSMDERAKDQREEDSMFASAGPRYMQGSKKEPPLSLAEQEQRELAKFKEETGGYLPPNIKVRHTAQGPVISMGKRDFEKTMRWLQLKEQMGQSTILGQRAKGQDPALERQMAMADRRESFAQQQMAQREQDAIEREERKQAALTKKETREAENDVGILMGALTGNDASLRALGNFISATSPRAAGAAISGKGFDPGFLAMVRQGLNTARGLAGGMEVPGQAGQRLRLTEKQSQNISEYLNTQEERLLEAESVQSTKQLAMDQFESAQRSSAMGALPDADVMGILQSLPQPAAGEYPGTAKREADTLLGDPVGTQYAPDVAAAPPSVTEGFGGMLVSPPTYRSPLKPDSAGLMPRNVAAAIRLQNIVKGNTPVSQAVLALMWGLGNSAQRERLKQYVQSQTALDDEDIAVRMVNNDPKWKEIVQGSLNKYRQYKRAEGR